MDVYWLRDLETCRTIDSELIKNSRRLSVAILVTFLYLGSVVSWMSDMSGAAEEMYCCSEGHSGKSKWQGRRSLELSSCQTQVSSLQPSIGHSALGRSSQGAGIGRNSATWTIAARCLQNQEVQYFPVPWRIAWEVAEDGSRRAGRNDGINCTDYRYCL